MKRIGLENIKDCQAIFSNGSDVLLSGKHLWLFRADGTFVTKFKPIRYAWRKVAFLPGNRALVDGSVDGFYHYISLGNGEILWSSVKKGRRDLESARFAVSKDGRTLYDVCYIGPQTYQVDRIIPEEQKHDRYTLRDTMRVTKDIFCDSDDTLCILQSHMLVEPETDGYIPDTFVRQYGILAVPFGENGPEPYWKCQWQAVDEDKDNPCGCDGKRILFQNFSVLELDTLTKWQLLDEEQRKTLPRYNAFIWAFEPERELLTVCYIGEKENVVIDCRERKIVARYKREKGDIGFKGCLVNDHFWTGTEEGVIRIPFSI